jgi:hypothetical protein
MRAAREGCRASRERADSRPYYFASDPAKSPRKADFRLTLCAGITIISFIPEHYIRSIYARGSAVACFGVSQFCLSNLVEYVIVSIVINVDFD